MKKNSQNNPNIRQGNDTKFKAQLEKVYNALLVKPMTMKEADVYSGVMRENICRYISTLLKHNRIALIRRRKCSITGWSTVNEYTADASLFPQSNQFTMF